MRQYIHVCPQYKQLQIDTYNTCIYYKQTRIFVLMCGLRKITNHGAHFLRIPGDSNRKLFFAWIFFKDVKMSSNCPIKHRELEFGSMP